MFDGRSVKLFPEAPHRQKKWKYEVGEETHRVINQRPHLRVSATLRNGDAR